MITDDDIADALWDVDEEDAVTRLAESACFFDSLAKAIVHVKCFQGDPKFLTSALDACMNKAEEIQQELAGKIVQDKSYAHRFQCEMKDDDWDDYKMRMTA
jgi:hypothetical protein